jgi:hypothetical protein
MHQFIILLVIVIGAIGILYAFKPMMAKKSVLKDIAILRTHTVNMLNKVLKFDTTKVVDVYVPDLHCDGLVSSVLSPDEMFALSHSNPTLYNKLVACGYTRTVGVLHGFALWSSMSKTKDAKSFKYFTDCINHIEWKDPKLFLNFHSTKSPIGKCII